MYVVSIEGQTIQLPPGVGEKDEDVKRAMTPFFPEVANALLKRSTKGEGDAETVTIEIVKRAGSKGLFDTANQSLIDCAGGKNPAVALYEKIEALDHDIVAMLELEAQVSTALEDGERQAAQMEHARERLSNAQPAAAASSLVLGF